MRTDTMNMKVVYTLFLLICVMPTLMSIPPAQATGSLTIHNNVVGYDIFIDGSYVVSSPTQTATIHNLAVGPHEVKLTKEDCVTVEERVTIRSGATTILEVTMICGGEQPPPEQKDDDEDGIPNQKDNCHNPGCNLVDTRGCPRDSDDDGLNDCEDECPTRKGSPVDKGCPQEEDNDKDKDGYPDDEDACHNPDCSLVDDQGCPLDSDNDGMDDCMDECPQEYGERRDKGCPAETGEEEREEEREEGEGEGIEERDRDRDRDRDGVSDDQDDCDNPECSLVDDRGCPRDSDGDGLNDCIDNCPDQPGPQGGSGCPQQGSCLGSVLLSILMVIGFSLRMRAH
jgi:hypothetical protein